MGSSRWGGPRGVGCLAAAGMALLVSACTPYEPAPTITQTPAPDVVPEYVGSRMPFDCSDPIHTAATLGELTEGPAALDVMALTTDGGVLQWGGSTYQGMTSVKVGIALRAGSSMTLSVPAEMRGTMKIGWSNKGPVVADELVVQGCTSAVPGAAWLVYPGGFMLKQPGCVPLTVTTAVATETIHVPIGKPCPGSVLGTE